MDGNETFLVGQDVRELLRAAGIERKPGASGYPHAEMQEVIDLVRMRRSELERALDKRAPAHQMDLLDDMRRLTRAAVNGSFDLNRSQQVEARHWLLYAAQECTSLRDWVIRDDMTWTGFIATLDGILAKLDGLRDYIAGKAPAPVHPNELAGAGAPPPGVIMAESNARRAAQ